MDPEAAAAVPCPAGDLHRYAALASNSDAFVVLSAAAATLALGLNLTQALVVLCVARSWKSAYHLALSLCGLLAAAALLWHVVALRLPQSTSSCGAGPSALSVAVLVGYVAHVTAPVVHRCIADTWPRSFSGRARNRGLCVLLSGFAWCETVLLAVPVLSDWPSPTRARDGTKAPCAIPRLWSSAFSTFVCALYTLHVVVDLVVLVDLSAASSSGKRNARRGPPASPDAHAAAQEDGNNNNRDDEDEDSVNPRNRVDLAPLWSKFALLLLGTLPLVTTMAYHMVTLPEASCPTFRDSLPLWTLLCTVVLGVVLPLVNVCSDPVVAGGSVHVLRKFWCCCRACSGRGRRVAPSPAGLLSPCRF